MEQIGYGRLASEDSRLKERDACFIMAFPLPRSRSPPRLVCLVVTVVTASGAGALTGVQRGFDGDDQDQRPDLLNTRACRATLKIYRRRRPRLSKTRSEQVRASRSMLGGRMLHTSRASMFDHRRPVGRSVGPQYAPKTVGLAPHWAHLSRCSGDGVKQPISVCAGQSGPPRQLRRHGGHS